jgi:hypothetical protein
MASGASPVPMMPLARRAAAVRAGIPGVRLGRPALGFAMLAALVVGYQVSLDALRVLAGLAGAMVLVVVVVFPGFFYRLFVIGLGFLLVGYAFGGRAFAHLGHSPVYVGEIVLTLGLLAALTNPRRFAVFRSPIGWLYLLFATWGAIRAVPYLSVYGIDTLRDSVTWAYGVFAVLVVGLATGPRWLPAVLQRYSWWLPWLLIWLPIGMLVGQVFPHLLPMAQESGQSMVFIKPSEGGVHLAGVATFLLLGLHRSPGLRVHRGLLGNQWFLGGLCILAFAGIAVLGRGGALAVLVSICTILALRPVIAAPRMAIVAAGAVTGVLLLQASNFSIEMGRRDFSAYQLTSNLLSIVGDAPEDERNLQQTRDWRLRWWTTIVNYTVYGPYFWTGKGFGVSLPIDDGIKEDTFNRSPHSAHMTVLARMGVPGEIAWLLLQSSFGFSMLAAYFRARRLGREWWARLNLWILAYWLAFLVAMSFGVYLEGPYGGIWFWCLLGFGIALLEAQRSDVRSRHVASREPYEAAARS